MIKITSMNYFRFFINFASSFARWLHRNYVCTMIFLYDMGMAGGLDWQVATGQCALGPQN
jgi:hypothetical protein